MINIKEKMKQPGYIFLMLNEHGMLNWLPDKIAIKRMFKYRMGTNLDLENPRTYNEKLQWIKLFDRNPDYISMVDKIAVRSIISDKIGEQYLIPLLGIWDKGEDIDFEQLPDKFVLKCSHDSGSVVFCKDKNTFDQKKAVVFLNKHLKKSGYIHGREWPYKDVPRKIIAEEYMVDESGTELKDYKVLCFSGEPKLIELHRGRYGNHTQDYYDVNWNRTSITQKGIGMAADVIPRPDTFEEMITLSKVLSEGIPHVRVDWYSINGKLYFGELTFFDASGFDAFDNLEDDLMIGRWIQLPPQKDNSQ